MKLFAKFLVFVLGAVAVYVASYVGLRCTVMRFGANRCEVSGREITSTHVYFGDGDNFPTRAARITYFPLHRAEHAWLVWRKALIVYE